MDACGYVPTATWVLTESEIPNKPPTPVARDTVPKGTLAPLERGHVRLGLMRMRGNPSRPPGYYTGRTGEVALSDAGGSEVGMRVAPRIINSGKEIKAWTPLICDPHRGPSANAPIIK